jgi:hypothetical protein
VDEEQCLQKALEKAPLAEPTPECVLPLTGRVNPAWADRLAALRHQVMEPLLGQTETLTAADWRSLQETFAPYRDWLDAKNGAQVEPLGREKLRRYLEPSCAEAVRHILRRDRAVADRLAQLARLKKLLLYHKHLVRLANNFVSFPELYDPGARAMFEEGSLVMDGRWFNFALFVPDLTEHAEVVGDSSTFVMYVELTRVGQPAGRIVAVPVTSGTIGNLRVGKRGVFFDVHGTEYDARVVRIIENPVSFKETLLAPFNALGRLIVGKIEAISGSAQKELESTVAKTADQVQTGVQQTVREAPQAAAAQGPEAPVPAESPAADSSRRRDLLVGASVSVAALSSAFAFITRTLADLKLTTVLAAVLVGLLLVFLPSAVVAFLKLRRRDLSAILEGSRWAINARMRLTRRQRRQFTRQEPYPADAAGTPRSRWWTTVLWVLVLALAGWGAWRGWRYLREREQSAGNEPARPANSDTGAPPADTPAG